MVREPRLVNHTRLELTHIAVAVVPGERVYIPSYIDAVEAWAHEVGTYLLRHTCDDDRCVQPTHLVPGTDTDNARDRRDRGRGGAPSASERGPAGLLRNGLNGAGSGAVRKTNRAGERLPAA